MNDRTTDYNSPNLNTADSLHSRESIPDLMRGLAGDLTTLFSKEIALAKAELNEAADEAKTAVASMATGGVLAHAGLVVLLLSAVFGLDKILELWVAALIVGLVALIIGFVMIKAAKSKMKPGAFKPERTVESLHKTKDTAESAIR